MSDERVQIYADGACRGNPGPGGWGALLRLRRHETEVFGGEPATTNNRMELTAVIRALEALNRPARDAVHRLAIRAEGHQRMDPDWKRAAGRPPTRSRSRTSISGSGSTRSRERTRSNGAGSRATPAIRNERADALANLGVDSVGR